MMILIRPGEQLIKWLKEYDEAVVDNEPLSYADPKEKAALWLTHRTS